MKVLITGATGLVGKAITKILHERGISVNYLTTNKEKIVSGEDFQGFYWNPAENEIDLECFANVGAVINLAGSPIAKRWTDDYKQNVLNSRINSLTTLYNGLRKIDSSQVSSFISASAIGIYPNSQTHYYEESEKSVDDSFIGEVVKKWENSIDTFKDFNLLVAKVRIGIVLSAEGGALPKIAKPVKNFVGAPLGSGKQWQSWIHIEDLAQLFVYILMNRLKGTFNGVSPNPVTNAKLTRQLGKVLNRPILLPNVPKFILSAILGEMSYLLFASQRVSSKKIEKKGFNFLYPNIGLALENLYSKRENGEFSKAPLKNELV
ncbi:MULTISPECIES: TIGR01777 family oxidoreductase [Flavobacteriaceae]|uniref:TIGR01777 family oxidoreductase n=1 Tax=Flavobacteriaceae TaxID=49546 RepID=UPI001492D20D|nr:MULTISPECIES: TIGR01777 family oxidoreductase [Allomuricauda]MDC6367382.1 TIGR01777 family oxidoreductase [Muricauda sp. AC10]